MNKCELCGSLSSLATDHYRRYRIPAEWERVCSDCAEKLNTHTVEQMSDAELAAAIMDHSHGYAGPTHAFQHVEAFRDGETRAHCERAVSCYPIDDDQHGGDLVALIEDARAHYCVMTSVDPDWALETVATLENWREIEDRDQIASMELSMMYPTGGV